MYRCSKRSDLFEAYLGYIFRSMDFGEEVLLQARMYDIIVRIFAKMNNTTEDDESFFEATTKTTSKNDRSKFEQTSEIEVQSGRDLGLSFVAVTFLLG